MTLKNDECLNVWIGTGRGSNLLAGTTKTVSQSYTSEILTLLPRLLAKGGRLSAQSDEIRVTCGNLHVACQEYGKWIPGDTATNPLTLIPSYSIKKILESGLAAANTCGKKREVAKPGELILFARAMSFWEKMKL